MPSTIQSLPAPPTEMLEEANKEESKYMGDMLRICWNIKQFRQHAKPVFMEKLLTSPTGKIMRENIESNKQYVEQLKEEERWDTLFYALKETSPKIRKSRRKFLADKLESFYELTSYCRRTVGVYINHEDWKTIMVKRYLQDYYQWEHQLEENKICLEKQVALAIAYIMCRKSSRWETCYPTTVKRLLKEHKYVLDYCQRNSPIDILKNRKELSLEIDAFNKSAWS